MRFAWRVLGSVQDVSTLCWQLAILSCNAALGNTVLHYHKATDHPPSAVLIPPHQLAKTTHALSDSSGTSVTRSEHSGNFCSTPNDTSSVLLSRLVIPPLHTPGTSACASKMALMNFGFDFGA